MTAENTDPFGEHTLTLIGEPRDVSIARGYLREVLRSHGRTDAGDDAVFVISELVTHAVLAGGPIHVSIAVDDAAVHLQVHSTAHLEPQPRQGNPDQEDGRGLVLVTSSSLWSMTTSTDRGTTMSARVPLTPPPSGRVSTAASESDGKSDC